jgi:ribonuclease VapC
MIVDTSALLAIVQREPDADRYGAALTDAAHPRVSAASFLELFIVADGRRIGDKVEALLAAASIEIAPVDAQQAVLAREAHRRFGSGRYGLNFGDCFAYALSKATGEPLLFKGEDFARTDVVSALA